MINLQRLDLNLLRTLDVLLSENNVTRAAQRLNLSQPSVSIQLARLREIFADPLLMPGPRGMQPTARADELRQPLRAALAALEQAVAPVSPFDPATAAETWRVAATDYMASAILLPERLVRGQSGLVVVEPPLAVAGFEMLMLWHERWHRDPAHQWLRQFIVNSLEEQTC
ncbi:TPA: LysR family transcriptional regulator [Klebsiella pneumoniae]|nr:LysR family transcriptional regulator [Klebsiella pneumoniae]HCC4909068.1 LysR family transcriptional regulator [Klebsiella pneumoniae]